MKLTDNACITFEQDIHAFVDHELDEGGMVRLTHHLDDCGGCRDYLDDMRELTDLHAPATAEMDEAVADLVDKHVLFGNITRTLLDERQAELSRLFYELGKAYVLEAGKAISRADGATRHPVQTIAPPMNIRSAADRARRIERECQKLETHAPSRAAVKGGSLFGRAAGLFESRAGAGAGALANGRRYLERALTLGPDSWDARLYLGHLHMLDGRYDRARVEFRRVLDRAPDLSRRMMAMQWLGSVYAELGLRQGSRAHYLRSIECYEEVIASGIEKSEPRAFMTYLHLAVVCAKAGLVGRAIKHFGQLVQRFPRKIEHSRGLLDKMADFSHLLDERSQLREDLEDAVPALFAA